MRSRNSATDSPAARDAAGGQDGGGVAVEPGGEGGGVDLGERLLPRQATNDGPDCLRGVAVMVGSDAAPARYRWQRRVSALTVGSGG